MSRIQSPSVRRRHRLVVGIAVLAFGVSACVPDTTPAPPTSGAAITVSKTSGLAPGDVVTISGTGFTTSGNIGTRPPLQGNPAGVYVVFGQFADVWQPSANAGGRTIIVQKWAVPPASRDILVGFPWLQDPASFVTIAADGSWTAEITVPAVDPSGSGYGFAVFPGSGASNSGEELLERVTLAPPVA